MTLLKKNIILIILAIVISTVPILMVSGEFGGADGEAEELIIEIAPNFEPIMDPVMEPASGEIESLLFVTQAAIGAGIIGFILGRMTARKED